MRHGLEKQARHGKALGKAQNTVYPFLGDQPAPNRYIAKTNNQKNGQNYFKKELHRACLGNEVRGKL